MTDEVQETDSKGKKDRSPSFPFIPLGTAVQRLEAFESYFGRHPTPARKAGLAWGFKEGSSAADQTLAALRSYGLIVYKGIGSNREVSISEEGRTYLRAQQESVRSATLKQAALRPRIIRKFWALWGADRPPDPVAIDTLTLQNKFSDSGAVAFLKVYDATAAFAKLSIADKIIEEGSEEEPRDEGEADRREDERPPKLKRREVPIGMKEDVFTLKEGDVVLQWPGQLSLESFKDLEEWTKLIMRKIQRHVIVRNLVNEPIPAGLVTDYTDDDEGRAAKERDRLRQERLHEEDG